jgi:hypothetical protein
MSKVDQCLTLADVYAKLDRRDDARRSCSLPALILTRKNARRTLTSCSGGPGLRTIGDSERLSDGSSVRIYWGVPAAELRAWPELDGLRNQQAISCTRNGTGNDSRR